MSGEDMALAFDYQKIDQAYLDDPFPTYASLREHDPVTKTQIKPFPNPL